MLRSSPGPKTGCSSHRPLLRGASEVRCDPHPVRRPGAARSTAWPICPRAWCCDPHPVRRPGAASTWRSSTVTCGDVAILTRSEDRVQPGSARPSWLTPPAVAILTRSEDRVQPRSRCGLSSRPSCCDPHPVRRPGAAGLYAYGESTTSSCDPHPVRRPGAARGRSPAADWFRELRSSPGPKTGCSVQSPPETLAPEQGCDPHPVRRPGAASSNRNPLPGMLRLRSSPGPKTGCSMRRIPQIVGLPLVAILTRSEDRVQPRTLSVHSEEGRRLRSSPGPKTGCSGR